VAAPWYAPRRRPRHERPVEGMVIEQRAAEERAADADDFVSTALWHQDNEHVLVVACPDPRFREARGEFIEARYGLRRYDPLIVPGGPQAVLRSAPYSFLVRDWVKLLDTAHGFKRIIGISHADCRAYKEAHPFLSEAERRVRQIEDLREFAAEMEQLVDGVDIDAYYSEPFEGRIKVVRVA
jgi:hypothetical protein